MNVKHGSNWVCRECGDPKQKHMANGLCGRCYQKQYRAKHRQSALGRHWALCLDCGALVYSVTGLCKKCYMKRYRAEHRAKLYQRKLELRELYRFGNERERIVERTGGVCERCGIDDTESVRRHGNRLTVHHRDGNGLSSENPNQEIENLTLLCIPCHRSVHAEMVKESAS